MITFTSHNELKLATSFPISFLLSYQFSYVNKTGITLWDILNLGSLFTSFKSLFLNIQNFVGKLIKTSEISTTNTGKFV